MPDDTGFYVEDICIPVSWWCTEEGVNDSLFIEFANSYRMIVITPGTYTTAELVTEIARAINEGYSVSRSATEFRKAWGSIIIKWFDAYILNDQVKSFEVLTNSELAARGELPSRVKRTINDLLNNFTSNSTYVKGFPFVSGYADMNPVRNAYLTCTGLGNFNTMSFTVTETSLRQSQSMGNLVK